MKTEIILTRGAQAARVTLSYEDPFTSASLSSAEGDENLLGIYQFYLMRPPSGYFVGPETLDNVETYLKPLAQMYTHHNVRGRVVNPPAFERYYTTTDDPAADH